MINKIKKAKLLAAATVTILICGCNSSINNSTTQTFNLDTTKLKSGERFYQCEMDPEIISDKSGNCPKCEMELSEIKKD